MTERINNSIAEGKSWSYMTDWTRIPGINGGTTAAEWRHKSGWRIKHCGHPTAHWPYYGIPPGADERDGNQLLLLSGGIGIGRAFQRLSEAKAAVLATIAETKGVAV